MYQTQPSWAKCWGNFFMNFKWLKGAIISTLTQSSIGDTSCGRAYLMSHVGQIIMFIQTFFKWYVTKSGFSVNLYLTNISYKKSPTFFVGFQLNLMHAS